MKPTSPQTKQPSRSADLLLQIEKPIYGGAFLARDEGKAVFVPLVLPGEEARVRIVEEKRGYSTAEAAEIVTTAAERVVPACQHFGACGGCQYQHASYAAQLDCKQAILRETLERGGVQAPEDMAVLAAEPWGYRNRIRLAVDAEGNPGYRGQRSHAIVPIAECPIAAPLLVRAALAFAETLRKFLRSQRASEISLFCDGEESGLLAGLHSASPAKLPIEQLYRKLVESVPELKGIEHISEGRSGRTPHTVSRWGADSLSYQAAGFPYRVDHGAFFQVNRYLIDGFVEHATAGLEGALAWDLFAGVGLFARRLAASFRRVIAVESAPAATAALAHNLSGTVASAVKAATLDFLRRTHRDERPDLIVVDPPRTGLGNETTARLAEIAAPTLVYVSCDPATLARDLRDLITAGYEIQEITLADLFPQTFHIETIVRLHRP